MSSNSSPSDVAGELPVDLTAPTRTKLFVLKNRWRTWEENQKVVDRIPSTFGNVELIAPDEDYQSAKVAVFLSCSDSTIDCFMFRALRYFFERDGSEALVFELNQFENVFQIRTLDELRKRVA